MNFCRSRWADGKTRQMGWKGKLWLTGVTKAVMDARPFESMFWKQGLKTSPLFPGLSPTKGISQQWKPVKDSGQFVNCNSQSSYIDETQIPRRTLFYSTFTFLSQRHQGSMTNRAHSQGAVLITPRHWAPQAAQSCPSLALPARTGALGPPTNPCRALVGCHNSTTR